MTVQQKIQKLDKQIGAIYLLICIGLFIAISSSKEDLAVIFRLIAFVLFIFGVAKINSANTTKQEENIDIDIKNDTLTCNNKKFDLNNSHITINTQKIDDFYKVSLMIETKKDVKTVFEEVIANKDELKELLELIKPYKKTNIDLLKNKINTITKETKIDKIETKSIPKDIDLFDKGLIVDNQEILYDEIEHFFTDDEKIYSKIYTDIKIELKNGNLIKKRILDENDKAKAYYAQIYFENGKSFPRENYKCIDGRFWIISFIVAVVLYFGFRGELFGFVGTVVSVFILTFYATYLIGVIHYSGICKRIKKIDKNFI